MKSDLAILCTRTMAEYASKVAYHIETFPEFRVNYSLRESVRGLRVAKFADGEMEIEVNTSLRNKDVFLFASAARNEHGISVEENKIEMYHAIDALRRARARRIVLFEPYCSCSRSDRITRKNSVGFWVHYKSLMSLGVNHILTYQLHSDKSKTIVDPVFCSIDDLPTHQLLEECLTDDFIRRHHPERKREIRENWVFCSVDAGSENLAKRFASDFECSFIVAHKSRDHGKANTVGSITLLTDATIKGKSVWIVDDMLDTAGSVYVLAQELKKREVKHINIIVTHPVLSPPSIKRLAHLAQEGMLQMMYVIDTINCDAIARELPFLSVISSARRSAEIVMCMHEGKSLSPFFEPFSMEEFLKKPTTSTLDPLFNDAL